MRLEVPLVPPSGNELRRKYRTVFAYRDLRMAWEKALKYCTGSAQITKEFVRQADTAQIECRKLRVEIEVHRAKVLDADNCMSGLKPVLDALFNVDFIGSDAPDFLELPLPRIVISRKRKTVIEITPA
jgi:hypothetical protein